MRSIAPSFTIAALVAAGLSKSQAGRRHRGMPPHVDSTIYRVFSG